MASSKNKGRSKASNAWAVLKPQSDVYLSEMSAMRQKIKRSQQKHKKFVTLLFLCARSGFHTNTVSCSSSEGVRFQSLDVVGLTLPWSLIFRHIMFTHRYTWNQRMNLQFMIQHVFQYTTQFQERTFRFELYFY